MVNAKLTIKNEMSAIDTKNRTWYGSLTDDEKKKVGIWVLMRYLSSVKNNVKDIEEHYMEFTNEIVNVHFNTLRHHPELQFKLMQAIGIGKQMYHPWIAPGKKGTEKPFYKWYKEQYKQYNDDEIEILIQAMTKDEQRDLLEQHGVEKKEIKRLLK